MEKKLSDIYYSPQGYWKGFAASKKLADAAGASEDAALAWLEKQAMWQIYLPPRNTYQGRGSMSQHQTRFIRPIFYFYRMTDLDGGGSFTSMRSLWSMLPRATRRLSLWLQRKRKKSRGRSSASTSEALCPGPSYSRSIQEKSSWVLSYRY